VPRKPLADDSTQTSLRLPKKLHDQLLAAAGDRGLGDEIRSRLEASFLPETREIDPPTQRLMSAISSIAYLVEGFTRPITMEDLLGDDISPAAMAARGSRRPWHSNAFSIAAFKHALDRVLSVMLKPPSGEIKLSPEASGTVIWGEHATPQEVGNAVAGAVLTDIRGGRL
jgi:hypothetical protein